VSSSELIGTSVEGVEGQPIDYAEISIDYSIIEHFSQHLYSSPNKAIEELVSNSFDALARVAHVYVPGSQVSGRVAVWDDGESMDADGLKQLWLIARSPKDVGDRVASNDRVAARKMIGKFGIGKVATYQLGGRITHLCKTPGGFLLVAVDYAAILPEPALASADGADDQRVVERAPILELDAAAAEKWARAQFASVPPFFDEMWAEETWTLAVVDELRPDVELPPGRLRWILGLSMPVRPDFAVLVNDEAVTPRLVTGAAVSWDMSTPELQTTLQAEWADAVKAGAVGGEISFTTIANPRGAEPKDVPVAKTPSLGTVEADVSIFTKSLAGGAAAEHGRSYGFFVMVRDRLINPQDPLLLLHDPSFGTFYRTQWVIRADALDEDLLADRERIRRATPRAAELEVIQRALYLAARERVRLLDEKQQYEESSEALLPIASREHYRDPLASLLLRAGGDAGEFDAAHAQVLRENREADEPLATVDTDKSAFVVNARHPFLDAVASRLGTGKKAREALRALDLVAISELLLEGFLLDLGLPEDQIQQVIVWRDGLLRQMARRFGAAPDAVIEEVVEASYVPGKRFETALAQLFELMGFDSERDGRSGQKDVLVIAPVGSEEFKFTVEAKASKSAVGNDDAEIDIAVAHRDAVDADHTIVVARQFTGFAASPKEGTQPMLLQQCESSKGVSIVSVDTLVALYGAVQDYYYPLDVVYGLLTKNESPEAKLAAVRGLQDPLDQFDYRAVLEAIWELQRGTASGDAASYRQVWQESFKGALTFDDFTIKTAALDTLAGGLIRLDTQQQTVLLRQSPDVVAARIQSALDARAASASHAADSPES
jgi:hypothetical protein